MYLENCCASEVLFTISGMFYPVCLKLIEDFIEGHEVDLVDGLHLITKVIC